MWIPAIRRTSNDNIVLLVIFLYDLMDCSSKLVCLALSPIHLEKLG